MAGRATDIGFVLGGDGQARLLGAAGLSAVSAVSAKSTEARHDFHSERANDAFALLIVFVAIVKVKFPLIINGFAQVVGIASTVAYHRS